MNWLFAYGSLIWRPDFEFVQSHPARLDGYQRRFCQASHDHRGTPEQPGRVVTLSPEVAAVCRGMAFELFAKTADQVLDALDEREQDGYTRERVQLSLANGGVVEAVTWIAHAGNPSWRGGESLQTVAGIIADSKGPSGSNREYLLELDSSLSAMGICDPHVSRLAEQVRQLGEQI